MLSVRTKIEYSREVSHGLRSSLHLCSDIMIGLFFNGGVIHALKVELLNIVNNDPNFS